MKKQFLMLALFLIISTITFSQNLLWVKKMGGSLDDTGNSITNDSSGNIYTTGHFTGTVDFDPGAGVYLLTSSGQTDIFISKLDANGNFLWAICLGGAGFDIGRAITFDKSGYIYITGTYTGIVNFNPGVNTFNLNGDINNLQNIFILKLTKDGDFVWAKKIGGEGSDSIDAIAIDVMGNILTIGHFDVVIDLDPSIAVYYLNPNGFHYDVFISKLDSSGDFIWAKKINGALDDIGFSVKTDLQGNIYATGFFEDVADFDPGLLTYNLTAIGSKDIFILKLDPDGNYIWARAIGGVSDDVSFTLATDILNNVYLAGRFMDTVNFNPGTLKNFLYSPNSIDAFILKMNGQGNFIWVKQIKGRNIVSCNSICVDIQGNLYCTGYFTETADFNPGAAEYNLVSSGNQDIYILKLDSTGDFLWANKFGGTSNDAGNSIITDASGQIYLTGQFQATVNFDPGSNIFNLNSAGFRDIFILKHGTSALGINTSFDFPHCSIYPNPSKNFIRILSKYKLEEANYVIKNELGQSVICGVINDVGLRISIEELRQGIYFLEVRWTNDSVLDTETYKIVKE